MTETREIRWLQVVGFPGYEVSDRGTVRSSLAAGFGKKPETPRILRATKDGHGYLRVYLRRDGWTHSKKVAWLVLESFVGPRPDKSDACHNDGNRLNDALENLRWDSRKANLEDCVRHGTRPRGAKVGTATLDESKVRAIRTELSSGLSQREIAKKFGVAQTTVSKINLNKRWGWLA